MITDVVDVNLCVYGRQTGIMGVECEVSVGCVPEPRASSNNDPSQMTYGPSSTDCAEGPSWSICQIASDKAIEKSYQSLLFLYVH